MDMHKNFDRENIGTSSLAQILRHFGTSFSAQVFRHKFFLTSSLAKYRLNGFGELMIKNDLDSGICRHAYMFPVQMSSNLNL